MVTPLLRVILLAALVVKHASAQEPIKLDVTGIGTVVVTPGQTDPASAVENFAYQAHAAGHVMSLEGMTQILEYFCARTHCARGLGGRIDLNVNGVGRIVVEAWEEPAEVVERFAAKAVAAGHGMNAEAMGQMHAYFCERKACTRQLTGPLTLTIEGLGQCECKPWEEPATAVERFAAAVVAAGGPMSKEAMMEMMAWFCKRRTCSRRLAGKLTLEVKGVGTVVCQPWEEPADAVEKFSGRAVEAGHGITFESMQKMHDFFCSRRQCGRKLAQKMSLNVKDVGTVVCEPWEEPADAVEDFATRAVAAGHGMTEEAMGEMWEFFCKRRKCTRRVSAKQTLDVKGIGSLSVLPWEEPADQVEMFTKQAAEAGLSVGATGMRQMMEYFCARRSCGRLQLTAPPSVAPKATAAPASVA